MQKKLIVGLGNWPKEYEHTKHNAGFIAVDELKNHWQLKDFEEEKKFEGYTTKGIINEKEVILLKPKTLMNNSGVAVKEIANFYKILPEDIIVLHDDSDIEFGKVKISKGKSSGGHKGVESIIQNFGTKDFTRIRIGVRSEKEKGKKAEEFVLKNFSAQELKKLKTIIKEIIKEVEKII